MSPLKVLKPLPGRERSDRGIQDESVAKIRQSPETIIRHHTSSESFTLASSANKLFYHSIYLRRQFVPLLPTYFNDKSSNSRNILARKKGAKVMNDNMTQNELAGLRLRGIYDITTSCICLLFQCLDVFKSVLSSLLPVNTSYRCKMSIRIHILGFSDFASSLSYGMVSLSSRNTSRNHDLLQTSLSYKAALTLTQPFLHRLPIYRIRLVRTFYAPSTISPLPHPAHLPLQ